MKTNAPVIIGIAVFAAILVGWAYTLPGTLKRAASGSDDALVGITLEGKRLFNDIKEAQTNIDKGVAAMNDIVGAQYTRTAAILNLKSKIETKQKIKTALENATPVTPPLKESVKP